MNCEKARTCFVDLLQGDAASLERKDVLEHLQRCEDCRNVYADYQRISTSWNRRSIMILPRRPEHEVIRTSLSEYREHIPSWRRWLMSVPVPIRVSVAATACFILLTSVLLRVPDSTTVSGTDSVVAPAGSLVNSQEGAKDTIRMFEPLKGSDQMYHEMLNDSDEHPASETRKQPASPEAD